MSFWSTLARFGGDALAPFTGGASAIAGNALGGVLDATNKGLAKNRGQELGSGLDVDKLALDQAAEQRNQRTQDATLQSDAWKKLLYAAGVRNQTPYTPIKGVPSFGVALPPRNLDPSVANGADAMTQAVMQRLQNPTTTVPGLPIDLATLAKQTKPSIWEKILNIAGPGVNAFGTWMNRTPSSSGGSSYPSSDPNE